MRTTNGLFFDAETTLPKMQCEKLDEVRKVAFVLEGQVEDGYIMKSLANSKVAEDKS